MNTLPEWSKLNNLKKSDFNYPDHMDKSIVHALDAFITAYGKKPYLLDDYRPGDPRQHGQGRAVDVTWPGDDPLKIWNHARRIQLFSGLGIYVNESGAVSFHFDTRLDHNPDKPALWGDLIEREVDPATGRLVRKDSYTTVEAVINVIKKNDMAFLIVAGLIGLALSWASKKW